MSDRLRNQNGPLSISVIMPAYNAAHYLKRSLPPLIAMRERGEITEVLVVDDCSPDKSTAETAAEIGATVVQMAKNGGPGAARNYAAKLAKGDVIWLVDADVVAHENSASVLRASFEDEQVAAVFGSYDSNPPADNFASQYKNLVHRYYHQRGKVQSDTFWSGCGAVRRTIFLELGGFDGGRYSRPSIEDIELGFRIRGAGFSIMLAHDLLCTHLKWWTLPEVIRTDIFQRAVPWSQLILSGRGMSDDLNVSDRERIKAAVAGLWFASILLCLAPSFWPAAPVLLLFLSASLCVLNRKLFSFFRENKGLSFSLAATTYHQFYYLYCAATFATCFAAHHFGRKKEMVVRGIGDRETAT